ncbi:hypothetical protein KA062_02860 [Patescibacteria group bacterium]|nr:hypothetical protein [Patescibacteria group bacterium]
MKNKPYRQTGNCIICGNKIKREEIDFEDFFTLQRGFNGYNSDYDQDYICFDCGQELTFKNKCEKISNKK